MVKIAFNYFAKNWSWLKISWSHTTLALSPPSAILPLWSWLSLHHSPHARRQYLRTSWSFWKRQDSQTAAAHSQISLYEESRQREAVVTFEVLETLLKYLRLKLRVTPRICFRLANHVSIFDSLPALASGCIWFTRCGRHSKEEKEFDEWSDA